MIIDIVGEPKVGKTTASVIFAKGASERLNGKFMVVDTTPGSESYPIFLKVMGYEFDIFGDNPDEVNGNKYYHAHNITSVRAAVAKAQNYKAIVIDSSDYLLNMAVDEYLKETGHKSVYPPTEWRVVRQKVIDIFISLMSKKIPVIIFTSPVKDEYKDMVDKTGTVKSMKTGRKVPAGFDKLSYIVDARIGIAIDQRKGRYYKVMLSRYFDVLTSNNNIYYGNDISFELLYNLVMGKYKKEVKK